MSWANHYLPPELNYCHGRADLPTDACFFQIIQPLDINKALPTVKALTFCLLGFRCDEGIRRNFGRVGANEGPLAIRTLFAKLPVPRADIICYDAGDITCSDGDLEAAQTALADVVDTLLKARIIPIVLGGGHELAWGHYQGIARAFPDLHLGIVNFDAHFDMRPLLPDEKGSSGTPFLQIAKAHAAANKRLDYNCIGIQPAGNIRALFKTAGDYEAQCIIADDLHQGHFVKCVNFVERVIEKNEIIYTSLCLDVFAAPYAPGVSAPQPLGVLPWHIIPLLRVLASSGKVISYDIAEMCPKYDSDQRTAKLAANMLYEIISHHSGYDYANN